MIQKRGDYKMDNFNKNNNDKNSIFIFNVNKILKDKSISHEKLANSLGVSRSYVTLLLNETRVISPKMMEKIATELQIPINQLLKSNSVSTNDYDIHLRGELSNRGSKIAFNNILLEMDNYIILTYDL